MERPIVALRPAYRNALAAFLVAFASSPVTVAAQQPVADTSRTAGAAAPPIPQPAPGFVQPKTPWGDPDLQGFWPGVEIVGVPLQRPVRGHTETRRAAQAALFERPGVREYWVGDPELDLIKMFRRVREGHLPRVAELTLEDRHVLETPLLPGLSIRLNHLFAR